MFADTDNSLGDIVRYLNEHQIRNLCGANWSTAHIMSGASGVLMKYIDEKVSELDSERKTLQEEIVTENVIDTEGRLKQITNHVKEWETFSFEDRQAVADTLIKVIRIADSNIVKKPKALKRAIREELGLGAGESAGVF